MNLRTIAAGLLVTSLVIAPAMLSAHRLAAAQARLHSAAVLLDQTGLDVQEVLDLRSMQQCIGLAQRPPQDVIAQVNAVLVQIGVPTHRLESLAPESDTAALSISSSGQAPQLRRQSLRLTLESMSVAEFGAFLSTWQQSQPMWTPTRIELLHSRGGTNSQSNTNQYVVTILLSALYVADNPR